MNRQKYLSLLGVALFCLTSMAGCPNVEPEGQLTTVKGTVTNLRTGRPLPGARMVVVAAVSSLKVYSEVVDSALTDTKGQYTFSFTNQKGLFYAVSCEQPYEQYSNHLDLPDSVAGTQLLFAGDQRRIHDVKLGTVNVANYRVSPRRVIQVQVATRLTGYQELVFLTNSRYLPADNQLRTVYLYLPVQPVNLQYPQAFYQQPSVAPTATFMRNQGTANHQDTTVQVKVSSPLTGDTVQATLSFGR